MPHKKSSRNEREDDEENTSDEDSTSEDENESDEENGSDEKNGSDRDNNNDDDAGTMDNLFQELLREQSVHAYACIEDFDPIVEAYERKSGNHLAVICSKRSIYQHNMCKEHVKCSFEIIIGRRRGNGMFAVKQVVGKHCGERCNTRARDGQA
jgi:hypothetical protein